WAEAQTEIAGSVQGISFQAGKSALRGNCRAVAIDDTEVCQRPLLSGVRVPFDVFEFRIEIGVCGDGKVRQWKRESLTGGFQEGFLARPAGKEARHAERIRQRPKSGAFAKGEKSLCK